MNEEHEEQIDQLSAAYLSVLLALAPAVGAERAAELTQGLVDASRAGFIRRPYVLAVEELT